MRGPRPSARSSARSLNTSKLALIYPRQSTPHQLEHNVYSLENQLKLADKALEHGFPPECVVVIRDDLGVSARTIEKRVGMTHALELIAKGLVGALYAEDLSRLSRDMDTVDHMEIGKRCRQAKVPMYHGGSWRDLTDRGTRLSYKRKLLLGKLDQATREFEALTSRGPALPHLDATLTFYRGLVDDAEFLATLPATWRDEPLDWRLSWVRRFIRRVVVTHKGRGRSAVAIEYLDGVVNKQELITRAGVTPEELDLARTLWAHTNRPPGRLWSAWMGSELAKAGYPRSRAGVVRLVALATGKKTKLSRTVRHSQRHAAGCTVVG